MRGTKRRNVRVVVEYDGTGYAGWHIQRDAPTIQGELVRAIRGLTGEGDLTVTGASRTDAGVHAVGQIANFLTYCDVPPDGILSALNNTLPGDIVIREAAEVPVGFSAQRDSTGKSYIYKVLNSRMPSAFLSRYAWFVDRPLDAARMREGARPFIGRKDFSSFMAVGSDARSFEREVTAFDIRELGDGIIEFEVRGNAFLRHMVRIMVGTIVQVGLGALEPAAVEGIIEARDRSAAPMTAPACGLTLIRVNYPPEGGLAPRGGSSVAS